MAQNMPDYSEMMEKAKEDIQCATEVWSDILPEVLGSRLESMYGKGSALKPWDSHIDYVPIISDIDIHISLKDDEPLFGSSSHDFDIALNISQKCEDEFVHRRPEHLHIPRMQVIETRFLVKNEKYTPPRPQDIIVLYGNPPTHKVPPPDVIRAVDLERICELEEYVDDMPRTIIDRTGLDWWSIIRTMSWRVSPSPVRILTQNHGNPIEVWSWNRTRIHKTLIEEGFDKLAEYYHGFYDAGWRLYLSDFKGLKEFRETARNGYYVLMESLSVAEKFRSK